MSQSWLALWLGILSAVGPLSIDMYLPAFPGMERELGAGAEITLATFFIGLGIGQLMYGPIADRFGRRGPLAVGGVIYALAGLACVIADSMGELAVYRLIQALGGSAGMVVTRAVVRDVAEGAAAARLMSRLMLVMGAAPILAPSLGAALLPWLGWRGIFAFLAVYGCVTVIIARLILPETLPASRRIALSPGAVLGSYLSVVTDRRFLGNCLAGGFALGGLFAWIAGSPTVLIEGFGLSPGWYALIFGSGAFGLIMTAQANPALLRRLPPAALLSAAMLVFAGAGLVLMLVAATGWGGLIGLMIPIWVMTSALGIILPNATVGALSRQGARAGTASALLGTMQFGLGAVSGVAIHAMQDGSPAPMAVCMLAGALLALAADRTLTRTS